MDHIDNSTSQTDALDVEDGRYSDKPIASIEHDIFDFDEPVSSGRESTGSDEAVFDNNADEHHSSSGTSHHSDDDISELPPDSRAQSCGPERDVSVLYTPHKQRSPFRNPSSVRAIQLDTTPPHLMSGSAPQHRYKRPSNVSRNSTPRSTRSYHSTMLSPRSSPTKKIRREHPLVLLHVTLLPVVFPYSMEIMGSVLPSYVIDNWKLLREKVSETVLERGILIPHPREDYDLLEERLLESLELKMPRILKCGHFHLSPEEAAEIEAQDDEYDSDTGDADVCEDCGRRIRDGRYGSGTGNRRWDLKIYASNGLMRAGAWGAAWREMERVDVEIIPWIDDGLRRELELRKQEDLSHTAATALPAEPISIMDEDRRREIYGDDAQAYVDGFADTPRPAPRPVSIQRKPEVPLSELLVRYVQHMLQDRRNFAIALLSVAVLFFAFQTGGSSNEITQPDKPSIVQSEISIPHASAMSSLASTAVEEFSETLSSTAPAASETLLSISNALDTGEDEVQTSRS